MGQRYVLRSAMIAVIALIVGMFDMTKQAHADNSAPDGYAFIDTFADRKATISVYNPLPGFMEELLRLDRKTQYIQQPPNGWQPFTQADIWMFFLNDPSELNLIGHHAKNIRSGLDLSDVVTGNAGSKMFKLTLHLKKTHNPDEIFDKQLLVHYFFVSKYSGNPSEIGCEAAAVLYTNLIGLPESERVAHGRACKAGG